MWKFTFFRKSETPREKYSSIMRLPFYWPGFPPDIYQCPRPYIIFRPVTFIHFFKKSYSPFLYIDSQFQNLDPLSPGRTTFLVLLLTCVKFLPHKTSIFEIYRAKIVAQRGRERKSLGVRVFYAHLALF